MNKKTEKRILDIIYSQNRENKLFSLEFFLFVLSKIYSAIVSLRVFLYRTSFLKPFKADVPVISVGNITSGGTGKTPFAIYISKLLLENGYRPAVLMRGYKGGFEKKGGIVSDGKKILASPADSGDEAFLIAKRLEHVSVICGKDRKKSASIAVNKLNANVLILDDGFSHLKIKRDIDILLLDNKRPFGNGYTIPRGLLRERKKNIKRSDALVYTRTDLSKTKDLKPSENHSFYSDHNSEISLIIPGHQNSDHKNLFLFSGLGNNEAFFSGLGNKGFNIVSHLFFNDHHNYTNTDFEEIIARAKKAECDSLITTMKDYCRIIDSGFTFPMDLIVMDASIKFNNDAFNKFLINRLNKLG